MRRGKRDTRFQGNRSGIQKGKHTVPANRALGTRRLTPPQYDRQNRTLQIPLPAPAGEERGTPEETEEEGEGKAHRNRRLQGREIHNHLDNEPAYTRYVQLFPIVLRQGKKVHIYRELLDLRRRRMGRLLYLIRISGKRLRVRSEVRMNQDRLRRFPLRIP